ncbi:hypothetical protein [Verminephrobacter eiseniae]|uniref:hypothetical protein n=1 Tax=Verminephrobacter eiseniae TaxID=364317 RepID=UPI002237D1C3|nr:hypothetical protein [Verminephrobacter eiseniae]
MPCSPSLRRTALLALSALLCGLAVPATPALAQEVYPSRPVTIVVVQSVDSTHEAVEKRLGMELDRWGRYEALYEYVDTMKENYRKFGTPDRAIAAYHGGYDEKNWGPETRKYVKDVLGRDLPEAPAQSPALPTAVDRAATGAAITEERPSPFLPGELGRLPKDEAVAAWAKEMHRRHATGERQLSMPIELVRRMNAQDVLSMYPGNRQEKPAVVLSSEQLRKMTAKDLLAMFDEVKKGRFAAAEQAPEQPPLQDVLGSAPERLAGPMDPGNMNGQDVLDMYPGSRKERLIPRLSSEQIRGMNAQDVLDMYREAKKGRFAAAEQAPEPAPSVVGVMDPNSLIGQAQRMQGQPPWLEDAAKSINAQYDKRRAEIDKQSFFGKGLYDQDSTLGAAYSNTMQPTFNFIQSMIGPQTPGDRDFIEDMRVNPGKYFDTSRPEISVIVGPTPFNDEEIEDIDGASNREEYIQTLSSIATRRQNNKVLDNSHWAVQMGAGVIGAVLNPTFSLVYLSLAWFIFRRKRPRSHGQQKNLPERSWEMRA